MKTAAKIFRRARAFTLVELMMYVAMVSVLTVMASKAYYRAADQSMALKQQTRQIAAVLRVGERWRADIRQAVRPPEWIENARPESPVLRLSMKDETIEYIFQENKIYRRTSEGAKEMVLAKVRASRMLDAARGDVPAVRWEVALIPRRKNPGMQPLFTFQAVPKMP
jgi:type II secretory pathway pseudopilin PulG